MKLNAGILSIVLVLIVITSQFGLCAENSENKFAQNASNVLVPFIAVGELSLYSKGKTGRQEALQGAKALAATYLATELLKITIREKRPNRESLNSFPSGHTSLSFAMATVLSDYQPETTLMGYGVASTIGWSRVEIGEHRWHDVFAGAALGYFIAKSFTRQPLNKSHGIECIWKW